MIYNEERRDLFSVPDDYMLVQCISADFKLGKGIAVEFHKKFGTRAMLNKLYPNYRDTTWMDNIKDGKLGDCIIIGRVANLITKKHYYQKPTYDSLKQSLIELRELCETYNYRKLAMPLIGCGLDKLQWLQVQKIIKKVFKDFDGEILICKKVKKTKEIKGETNG